MPRPTKRIKRKHEHVPAAPRCFLLELPIELRLLILNFALADTSDVTITVAELERNILDSSEPESTIAGIPGRYVLQVKNAYDPGMLKIGKPTLIPPPERHWGVTQSMDSGYGSATSSMCDASASRSFNTPKRDIPTSPLTSLSLRLTNKQLHAEMSAHIKHSKSSRSTIHVNYPYGIIALQKIYPSLLWHAEKICISGWYEGSSCDDLGNTSPSPFLLHADRLNNPTHGPALDEIPKETLHAANSALSRLMRTSMAPTPHATLKQISMRIFYPKESAYSLLWSSDASPIAVALKNICGGKIEMKLWRGGCGSGVVMNVRPSPQGRHVSTTWRKFRGPRAKETVCWQSFGVEDAWKKDVPEEECWIVA
jgi:hypothetical protein